ncbi:MAG: hypothetical protein PHG48_02245 [Eubacteriales bacterium]|nr:hypothetical protein [Eubacteriales bacterium]
MFDNFAKKLFDLKVAVKFSKPALRSRKGGISTVIAVLVTTVMALGLVSYSITGQVASAKETGEKAQLEQQKINLLMQDGSYVCGSTVKGYIAQAAAEGSTLTASVQSYENGVPGDVFIYTAGDIPDYTMISDSSIYHILRTYDAAGKLSALLFVQVDLSR